MSGETTFTPSRSKQGYGRPPLLFGVVLYNKGSLGKTIKDIDMAARCHTFHIELESKLPEAK